MHKCYLHVTDKQAEPCWRLFFFFPSLILEEVSAGSLPRHQNENHPSSEQPMAADLRPSPKHYLNSLWQAQTFLNRHFGNTAACRVPLQLPTDLPRGWHADSTTEIKTAPQGGGEKKKKAHAASTFCYMHPLGSRFPAQCPHAPYEQLHSKADVITRFWGTCNSNEMIS